MGYDIPAAIGAYYANPSAHRIICIAGDGSMMMNIQELQTIAGLGLPIKLFVLNNDGYHSIRQTQQNYFPDNMPREEFYQPVERGFEREILKRLEYWKKLREKKR